MEMRLCADCRHFEASPLTEDTRNYDRCTRPNAAWATVDLVRGQHRPAYAEQERAYTTRPNICGPDAKHWEPSMGYLKSVDDEEEPHVISF